MVPLAFPKVWPRARQRPSGGRGRLPAIWARFSGPQAGLTHAARSGLGQAAWPVFMPPWGAAPSLFMRVKPSLPPSLLSSRCGKPLLRLRPQPRPSSPPYTSQPADPGEGGKGPRAQRGSSLSCLPAPHLRPAVSPALLPQDRKLLALASQGSCPPAVASLPAGLEPPHSQGPLPCQAPPTPAGACAPRRQAGMPSAHCCIRTSPAQGELPRAAEDAPLPPPPPPFLPAGSGHCGGLSRALWLRLWLLLLLPLCPAELPPSFKASQPSPTLGDTPAQPGQSSTPE